MRHAGELTERVSVISADYIIKQQIITNDFLASVWTLHIRSRQSSVDFYSAIPFLMFRLRKGKDMC